MLRLRGAQISRFSGLKLLLLPLCVLAPAFFAGSETALTSLSGLSLSQILTRHPALKPHFEFWKKSQDKILMSAILGNTLCTVICGVLAASIGSDISALHHWTATWVNTLSAFFVTMLVLLFGEILPKILGRHHSERVSVFSIAPLALFTRIIYPFIQFLTRLVSVFVWLLGAESKKEIPSLGVGELKEMLVGDGPATSSRRILKNILEFGQLQVKDIMKPMENVVAVDLKQKTSEIISTASSSLYSRIPVYNGSIKKIVGILYSKDLLVAWRTEGLLILQDLIREPYFVNEDSLVSDLLRQFKAGTHHLAMVKNSGGDVVGVITIEDILEEIVGEVYDERKV